jgi:phosphate:Na+ symporter
MHLLVIFGGVGLFLVGMVMLTEGLRGIAGDALRRWPARFTTTPASGIATGALTTAIVQSSSATTVAAVGFVGAGLLTFPQALGIIFGANIGTTITGWLVAILGFKLQIGAIAQLLIFLGVLLKIFANGKLRHIGWALAGFGLLFFAIDTMKIGMAPYQGMVTPEVLPDDTWLGRIQLVFIGIAITVVTQSSSAGVAIALVSLGTGAIALPQAAAMVIGMDVGTTFTAALATLGGSTATRQTGYAHVIYNVMTAIMALLLLDTFAVLADSWKTGAASDDQIALVAFHTAFNTLGAVVALPLTQPFARLIMHLVPARGPILLRRLDDRLLEDPASAVDTAAATVRDLTYASASIAKRLLEPGGRLPIDPGEVARLDEALEGVQAFVGKIRTDPAQSAPHRRHIATVHILDHTLRLSHRYKQQARIDVIHTDARLRRLSGLLRNIVAMLETENIAVVERKLDRLRQIMRQQRHVFRTSKVEAASVNGSSTEDTIRKLDALRWLHRVEYHYWRMAHHLRVVVDDRADPMAPPENGLLETEED